MKTAFLLSTLLSFVSFAQASEPCQERFDAMMDARRVYSEDSDSGFMEMITDGALADYRVRFPEFTDEAYIDNASDLLVNGEVVGYRVVASDVETTGMVSYYFDTEGKMIVARSSALLADANVWFCE